MSSMN
jgi:hypothetical protein